MRYLWIFFLYQIGVQTTLAQQTLPKWVFTAQADQFIEMEFPTCLEDASLLQSIARNQPSYALIKFPADWNPTDWSIAAFEMKTFIVSMKALNSALLIGVEGEPAKISAILIHDLAPYVDGYLFDEIPWIPDEDLTGKGWFRAEANSDNLLTLLVDAGSVGAFCVLLDHMVPTPEQLQLLEAVNQSKAGTMDQQPEVVNLKPGSYQFLFDPGTSTYFLAYYAEEKGRTLYFNLKNNLETSVVFPRQSATRVSNYGDRVEIVTDSGPHLIRLKMLKPEFQVENIQVQSKASLDPYELVVKNQVFKKMQAGEWRTLQAIEDWNYRYQAPTGATVDVTYRDSILWEKDRPIEHVREKMFVNGIAWPYEDLPELPLIQPDKVQSEPLVIELDKSYTYTYGGEDVLGGHKTWKVGFKPNSEGDFYSGTVWIDQVTAAHRKIRAVQSGLEPPVVGNEITVFYDWVEQQGKKIWIQVREENLQILNIVGARIPLQITSERREFRFDNPDFQKDKDGYYEGDKLILRDTPQGFRYLDKENGQRVVSEKVFSRQKFIVGGVLYDPGMDTPVPLAGFNYINLDFLKKGYQANFFIAGAINDIIVSDNNFLGKGWDLTAEVFVSALYFSDSIYRLGEKADQEEIEKITESFNLTLGIPLGTFFKFEANVASRFIDFKDVSGTSEDFILPQSHFENQARFNLFFDRGRFTSDLEFAAVKRSKWETWGLPDNPEPLFDSFRKLTFDTAYSRKLPSFQNIRVSARYLKGWDLDRFSRFGFGFFENHVAGFGASGIEASQAVRLRLGYSRGIKELFQLGLRLDAARAWQDDLAGVTTTPDGSPVDLLGAGFSLNLIGPWKTVIRLEIGYGIKADLENEAGDITGQLVFLKLF